ncbi:uncharacterized protein BCR38DRAFT_333712, partial [Pseudomassariella vexata]
QSGIGTALAKNLVSKNWLVALLDVNAEAGQELVRTLGPNTIFLQTDVSSYTSQSTSFLTVFRKWHRIDALLANAGVGDRSSVYILPFRSNAVDDIPPAPDTSCTDIDYKGVLYGVQLAVHFMRHNPSSATDKIEGDEGHAWIRGKVVVTCSVVAVSPHFTYPEYNGAKAGVLNFVRGVAPVLKLKEGILINAVCPGVVATAIVPPEMIAAVSPEFVTPVSTVVRAYDEFLDEKDERSGVAVEATVDKVLQLEEPKLRNGRASERSVQVWEPLFRMLHGEDSGILGAIP